MNAPNSKSNPQNWLLITFDQWRGDWLYQDWLHLPNLRQLAYEGWDLRRCYTSSPMCVPARASWLTGKTPGELGVTTHRPYTVPANSPSFVRNLRDQKNYHTVLTGKAHWTPHETGVDLRDNLDYLQKLGFNHAREIAGPKALAEIKCELTDLWNAEGLLDAYRKDLKDRYLGGCIHTVRPSILPDSLYPDLWLTNVALQELEALPEDSPWFLWVSFPGPHEPFDVPKKWRNRNKNLTIPPPVERPKDCEYLADLAPPGSALYKKIARWPEGIPLEALIELRKDYSDHLSLLDAQLGELMNALFKRPDQKNTAITVCSDHGELLGDWGLLLKGCFLEGAIRSLFIHRPPEGLSSWRQLFSSNNRPFGLTEAMWSAAKAVSNPIEGSFGSRLLSLPKRVLIEYGDERMILRK